MIAIEAVSADWSDVSARYRNWQGAGTDPLIEAYAAVHTGLSGNFWEAFVATQQPIVDGFIATVPALSRADFNLLSDADKVTFAVALQSNHFDADEIADRTTAVSAALESGNFSGTGSSFALGSNRLGVAVTGLEAAIKQAVTEAYDSGYDDGYADGYADGFEDGFTAGRATN